MTIKKYLLIIIFFIIVFIAFQNVKNINENFSDNYFSQKYGEYNFLKESPGILYPYNSKNINVQLSNIILHPLNLKYDQNSQFQLSVNKKLINLFPIEKQPYNNINQIIKLSNKETNILSYLNEDILIKKYTGFEGKEKLSNLRYVCALTYSHYTLVTPLDSEIKDWTQLENKEIGTVNNSSSLMNLKSLLSILDYKNNKVNINVVENILYLKKMFLKSKIDAIYLTTEHPNLFLEDLSKNIKIRIITTEGLPEDKLALNFPSLFKKQIDLRNYDNYPVLNPLKQTYATRKLLISNNKTNGDYIYKFLKTFLENIQYIISGIKQLNNYNPIFSSFAFASIPYHLGAEKFYNEHNYITYSRHNLCYLYSGTKGKCNISKINQNRFIRDKSDPINYKFNFTVLSPENKWNNIVNDWNYEDNGKRFKDSFEYQNPSSKPLLVSNISLNSETNKIFTNYVNQIKYSPGQLFPNL